MRIGSSRHSSGSSPPEQGLVILGPLNLEPCRLLYYHNLRCGSPAGSLLFLVALDRRDTPEHRNTLLKLSFLSLSLVAGMFLLHFYLRLGGLLGLTNDVERGVNERGLGIEGDVHHRVGVVRVSSREQLLLRVTSRLLH